MNKQNAKINKIVSKTVAATVSAVRAKNKNKKPIKNKNNNRKKGFGALVGTTGATLPARINKSSWANMLNNPFEAPVCRLGFNSFIKTDLYTATARFVTTANADGSLAVVVQPFLLSNSAGPILINSAGAGSGTWAAVGFTNAATIASVCSECRILGVGLKIVPNIPLTVAPGFSYIGAITPMTWNEVVVLTPNNLALSPYLRGEQNRYPALMVGRPTDLSSTDFAGFKLNAGINTDPTESMPTFLVLGGPPSAKYSVEAILIIEGYSSVADSASSLVNLDEAAVPLEPGISDYFPSVDQAWTYTKTLLRDSGVTGQDVLSAGADTVANFLSSKHGYAQQRLGA